MSPSGELLSSETVSFVSFASIGLLGLGLGGLNVLGLWWSVRAMPRARHPAAILLLSFLLRFLLTFGPLFLLADGAPARLIVGLGAVMLGRWITVRILGVATVGPAQEGKTVEGKTDKERAVEGKTDKERAVEGKT